MDDVTISEYSSVAHWELPLKAIVTRFGVRIQDKKPETIAMVHLPTEYSPDEKVRVAQTIITMFELRHANWEAAL